MAKADLASVFCQDEYKIHDEKTCTGLLIGAIDALEALGYYCADGNTSYGYITETWRRLLKRDPNLKEIPTLWSVKRAIEELSLMCEAERAENLFGKEYPATVE